MWSSSICFRRRSPPAIWESKFYTYNISVNLSTIHETESCFSINSVLVFDITMSFGKIDLPIHRQLHINHITKIAKYLFEMAFTNIS